MRVERRYHQRDLKFRRVNSHMARRVACEYPPSDSLDGAYKTATLPGMSLIHISNR